MRTVAIITSCGEKPQQASTWPRVWRRWGIRPLSRPSTRKVIAAVGLAVRKIRSSNDHDAMLESAMASRQSNEIVWQIASDFRSGGHRTSSSPGLDRSSPDVPDREDR